MVVIYRASELGKCSRALVARCMGIEAMPGSGAPTPAMQFGIDRESAVAAEVERQLDCEIVDRQKEIELHFSSIEGPACVHGHIDGIVQGGKCDAHIIEIKTMSTAGYRDFLRKGITNIPLYSVQLSVYMLGTGLPGLLVAAERTHDFQIGEIDWQQIATPVHTLDWIKQRVRRIEAFAQLEELPDCDVANRWFCRYWHLHN